MQSRLGFRGRLAKALQKAAAIYERWHQGTKLILIRDHELFVNQPYNEGSSVLDIQLKYTLRLLGIMTRGYGYDFFFD